MIVDMAILGPRANLPAAEADGLHRIFALEPRADIEVMHVLFDVEIARQPGEVVPIPHLPRHVAPVRLSRLDPDTAAVIVSLQRPNFADLAIVDALDRLLKTVVV